MKTALKCMGLTPRSLAQVSKGSFGRTSALAMIPLFYYHHNAGGSDYHDHCGVDQFPNTPGQNGHIEAQAPDASERTGQGILRPGHRLKACGIVLYPKQRSEMDEHIERPALVSEQGSKTPSSQANDQDFFDQAGTASPTRKSGRARKKSRSLWCTSFFFPVGSAEKEYTVPVPGPR